MSAATTPATPAATPDPAEDLADDAALPSRPLPDFQVLPEMIAGHARARPRARALVCGDEWMDYAGLDATMDRVATALQRDGCRPGDRIAICAQASIAYVAVFMGALRAGLAVAPLAPGGTPAQILAMAADAGARCLFVDAGNARALAGGSPALPRVRLDGAGEQPDERPGERPGERALSTWLTTRGDARPRPVALHRADAFNLIYSSGTTGTPKGIVQSHVMRWAQIRRAEAAGYGPDTVTLIATPLYSNTTLVVVVPTLARGGCIVLCPKFDCAAYLALAERHRATHTMLVPVQYQRLMQWPDFDRHDLSGFRFKACTSAPFDAALKAEVLRRWPGALVEYYGMTEGGGSCILNCHDFPHKLHTVGQPAPQNDIRLIDEDLRELPRGGDAIGEVVGRSPAMMNGYHGQPALSAAAEWHDAQGRRFIRTGDVGRFDEDGFLILMDRRKDMIISGGFNIYPSDLEAQLRQHPAVADAAVVGIASAEWGETPVAYVVRRDGHADGADDLRAWLNGRVGKTQRLSGLRLVDELPRSAIGKVLKRELRERWAG
jgi:acyl-CoA synthetase (AMP-forming)/AMP-acid ligase II